MSRQLAGSLGSDAVGKSAEVTYQHGNITSTIRDVIERVEHSQEGVRFYFRGTKWTRAGIHGFFEPGVEDYGLLVSSALFVIVQDD